MNLCNTSALDFSTFFMSFMEKYGTIENLQCKAKSGDIIAQGFLGMAYSEGLGKELPKDADKAIGWLFTTVERGCEFPFIHAKLGELLDRKGTIQHRRKAYEMFQRAARLGCTSSQIKLAEMYRCGVEGVVNQDLIGAFQWYKKAAGEGLSNSCGGDLEGFGKLFAEKMKQVEAAMGDEPKKSALLCLYKLYLKGDCPEGRPQPTKAVHYLTKAAELGDSEAQLKLGQVYLRGSCEQVKDVVRAKRWLEKAASKGEAKAERLLQQCEQLKMTQHSASHVRVEALTQSFGTMEEKLKERSKIHPMAILQPVSFSEEMLSEFDWSPTARIYLKAFKLVKEGWEILHNSNFMDKRGISLIAYGYLTENSILQAFPLNNIMKTKRGLGYCLLNFYTSTAPSEMGTKSEGKSTQVPLDRPREGLRRKVHKYSLWTGEQLFDGAEKTVKEFLAEAPSCWKTYPNAYYYLAQLHLFTENMVAFKKSYELGQDAEEKRLPFLNPVNLQLKDVLTPCYQSLADAELPVMCGNRMCTKNVKQSKLLTCSSCGKQKYCGKECQTADWKNHKAACHASGESKRKETAKKT